MVLFVLLVGGSGFRLVLAEVGGSGAAGVWVCRLEADVAGGMVGGAAVFEFWELGVGRASVPDALAAMLVAVLGVPLEADGAEPGLGMVMGVAASELGAKVEVGSFGVDEGGASDGGAEVDVAWGGGESGSWVEEAVTMLSGTFLVALGRDKTGGSTVAGGGPDMVGWKESVGGAAGMGGCEEVGGGLALVAGCDGSGVTTAGLSVVWVHVAGVVMG